MSNIYVYHKYLYSNDGIESAKLEANTVYIYLRTKKTISMVKSRIGSSPKLMKIHDFYCSNSVFDGISISNACNE